MKSVLLSDFGECDSNSMRGNGKQCFPLFTAVLSGLKSRVLCSPDVLLLSTSLSLDASSMFEVEVGRVAFFALFVGLRWIEAEQFSERRSDGVSERRLSEDSTSGWKAKMFK